MPETMYNLNHATFDQFEDQSIHDLKQIELTSSEFDVLVQLVEDGPVWDGDVISKSGRTELLRKGMAAKIIVKGEDGYQAATYKGQSWYLKYYRAKHLTAINVNDIATARRLERIGERAKESP